MVTQYAVDFVAETITEFHCENPVYTKAGKLRTRNVFVDAHGKRYKSGGGVYIGDFHGYYPNSMELTRELAEAHLARFLKAKENWEAGQKEREALAAVHREEQRLRDEERAAKRIAEQAEYEAIKAREEEEWQALRPVIQAEWEGLVARLPVYPGFERLRVEDRKITAYCTRNEAMAFSLFSEYDTARFYLFPLMNMAGDGCAVCLAYKGQKNKGLSEGLTEFVEIIEKHREYLEAHVPGGLGPDVYKKDRIKEIEAESAEVADGV